MPHLHRRPALAALLSATTFGVYDLLWLNDALTESTPAGERPRLLRWWVLLLLYIAMVLVPLFYLNDAVLSRLQTGPLSSEMGTFLLFAAAAVAYCILRAGLLWTVGRRLPVHTVPPALHLLVALLPPLGFLSIAALQRDLNRAASDAWAPGWRTAGARRPAPMADGA